MTRNYTLDTTAIFMPNEVKSMELIDKGKQNGQFFQRRSR
jgi:hypothetical protein